jgi:hypothetical protein
MKKQTILGLLAVLIFATGCKVTKQTKGDYDVMYITKTGIIQRPLELICRYLIRDNR